MVAAQVNRSTPIWTAQIAFGLVRAVDALVLSAALLGSSIARHQGAPPTAEDIYALILTVVLALYFFRLSGLFELDSAASASFVAKRTPIVGAAATCLAHLPQLSASGLSFLIICAPPVLALTAWRFALAFGFSAQHTQSRWRQRVAIIGAGEHGRRLLGKLCQNPREFEVIGIFDDRRDRLPCEIDGVPVLGAVDDLLALARVTQLDRIIVALPRGAERRLADWLKRLSILPVELDYCPDAAVSPALGRDLPSGPLPLVTVSPKPLGGWSGVVKSIEDRVLAVLLLVLASPLLAMIAVAIKLTSKGPIIFRQRRYGFNNNIIEVLKFRTMHAGESSLSQAVRDDPRVTGFGRMLRRTSLDELPQLWNVIRGDMSLVGPRPHAVAHNEHYARLIDAYLGRHRVKPGITGWAQVNGLRGETETLAKMDARVQHDLFYIENWSLKFDLLILARTLVVGFRHPNAY